MAKIWAKFDHFLAELLPKKLIFGTFWIPQGAKFAQNESKSDNNLEIIQVIFGKNLVKIWAFLAELLPENLIFGVFRPPENTKKSAKIQKWRFFDAVFAEKSKIILFTILTIQTIHNNYKFSSKSEKPHFWPRKPRKHENRTFPGKTAVYVSCPYSDKLSWEKSEKTNEPFSETFCN